MKKTGAFVFSKARAMPSELGKRALVVDDNTVSTAATTNSIACGYVMGIADGAHIRGRIDRAVM